MIKFDAEKLFFRTISWSQSWVVVSALVLAVFVKQSQISFDQNSFYRVLALADYSSGRPAQTMNVTQTENIQWMRNVEPSFYPEQWLGVQIISQLFHVATDLRSDAAQGLDFSARQMAGLGFSGLTLVAGLRILVLLLGARGVWLLARMRGSGSLAPLLAATFFVAIANVACPWTQAMAPYAFFPWGIWLILQPTKSWSRTFLLFGLVGLWNNIDLSVLLIVPFVLTTVFSRSVMRTVLPVLLALFFHPQFAGHLLAFSNFISSMRALDDNFLLGLFGCATVEFHRHPFFLLPLPMLVLGIFFHRPKPFLLWLPWVLLSAIFYVASPVTLVPGIVFSSLFCGLAVSDMLQIGFPRGGKGPRRFQRQSPIADCMERTCMGLRVASFLGGVFLTSTFIIGALSYVEKNLTLRVDIPPVFSRLVENNSAVVAGSIFVEFAYVGEALYREMPVWLSDSIYILSDRSSTIDGGSAFDDYLSLALVKSNWAAVLARRKLSAAIINVDSSLYTMLIRNGWKEMARGPSYSFKRYGEPLTFQAVFLLAPEGPVS